MVKACLAFAFFCLVLALPLRAFDWETATSNGREYVTLQSFCAFYGFGYQAPSGNDRFTSRNAAALHQPQARQRATFTSTASIT